MNLSDELIEQLVLSLGRSFDSHEVIRKLAQQHQHAYIADLGVVVSDNPFQTFHSALGRRIKTICERHGYTGEASRSPDFFGQDSNCVLWSRADGL